MSKTKVKAKKSSKDVTKGKPKSSSGDKPVAVVKKRKPKPIMFYVKEARYDFIKKLAKKEFGFRLTYKEDEDWDLAWHDTHVQPD